MSSTSAMSRLGSASATGTSAGSADDNVQEWRDLEVWVRRAMREQLGVYDVRALRVEAAKNGGRVSRLHADFFAAEDISVSESGCVGGRGIVAKRPVQRGALLLASKAFAFSPKVDKSPDLVLAANPYSGYAGLGAQTAQVSVVMDKLKWCSAQEQAAFYSLWSGCEDSTPPSQRAGAVDGLLSVPLIEGILACNSFSDLNEVTARANAKSDEAPASLMMMAGSGLWIVASLFNHSCCPNASYDVVGDFLFVRAIRDVREGEEVCVPYLDLQLTFEERCKRTAVWGLRKGAFQCTCLRCSTSRQCPELVKAEEKARHLYATACQNKSVPERFSAKRDLILDEFRKFPAACGGPQSGLCELSVAVSMHESSPKAFEQSMEWIGRWERSLLDSGLLRPHDESRLNLALVGILLCFRRNKQAEQVMNRVFRVNRSRLPLEADVNVDPAASFYGLCEQYGMCAPSSPEGAAMRQLAKQAMRKLQVQLGTNPLDEEAAQSRWAPAVSHAPQEVFRLHSLSPPSDAKSVTCAVPSLPSDANNTSATVSEAAPDHRCSACGSSGPGNSTLLQCGRCRRVRYCSKDCQRRSWLAGHKAECTAALK